MRFLTILKSGVSVENVAVQFVQTMLKRSWRENELSLELTCDFVNDVLAAIGLECSITPEQISADGSYVWPVEQIQVYNFHYVEQDFKKLEEFLIKDLHEDIESPVEYLMQIMAVWCNVYRKLQKMEEFQAHKHIVEPLARINFHLLVGMHEIRKIYGQDLHLLNAICNRLYWSALQGLFYQQTHGMIFSGLLTIFSKNYDLFYACSPRTIDFFYEAFAVQINALTPLKLYQALQNMLLEADNNKLHILLNFLIEPYMLQVYFTTLVAKKHKWYDKITAKNVRKIQQEAINFLDILQSKLLTLDCFSREFMESILNLAFKRDNTIPNLACNLYIKMMKRKFSEQMILKHIMVFYVTHLGTIAYLGTYVQSLYESFEYLLNFNNLLEIITDIQTEEIIRLLSAHILVIVLELKIQRKDYETKEETQHLLEILPEIFENLNCQKTEGILLKAYSIMPIEKLKKPIIDNFIHYAVGIFTYTATSLEYPLLMNIFTVFHKFLIHNKEWHHLELLSEHLLSEYYNFVKNLKHLEEKQQQLYSKRSIELYNSLLKRINIILKTEYDLLDNNYLEFIRNMCHYFLYNVEFKSLISETKSLIDLYILEIIISCILKLIKYANSNNQKYTFLPEVQELFRFLWLKIKSLDELLKFPIVRIKTYFCCFLQLIKYLPLNLKLDTHVYHQLIQILIEVNFKNKFLKRKGTDELQQIHPLQSLEYRRLMLRQFTEMHKCQRVLINTNSVWKLCIYYGMVNLEHNFREELKNLLITLANYRLKIYKHIISILIYNLYNRTYALKHMTIVSILKQHKHLIENEIKIESPSLLKIHVVLLVFQILEKALSVKRINTGQNRLEAVRDLYIFIADLDLNQLQAKQLILEQLGRLRKHVLVSEELKVLSDFKKAVN